MNANMKVSEQCRIAASKGNQVLGMIRRKITYKDNILIVPLYKAIVRPHLEYCIQAWSPYHRKDIDMLEKYRGNKQTTHPTHKPLFPSTKIFSEISKMATGETRPSSTRLPVSSFLYVPTTNLCLSHH